MGVGERWGGAGWGGMNLRVWGETRAGGDRSVWSAAENSLPLWYEVRGAARMPV